jgi:hypothetical protein
MTLILLCDFHFFRSRAAMAFDAACATRDADYSTDAARLAVGITIRASRAGHLPVLPTAASSGRKDFAHMSFRHRTVMDIEGSSISSDVLALARVAENGNETDSWSGLFLAGIRPPLLDELPRSFTIFRKSSTTASDQQG